MIQFIELTQKVNKVVLNVNAIERILQNKDGSASIYLSQHSKSAGSYIEVKETYTEIKKLLLENK